MKKETNPKAKRNGLWCNVLIVAALLLIVAVLMVVLRRNAPANVDANAPLLPLTATDAPTEAPTELATSTPEAAATPEITAAPEAAAAPEVTDVPEATATPDLSQVEAFLVVTVGDKTYQPIPLTEEGYYRLSPRRLHQHRPCHPDKHRHARGELRQSGLRGAGRSDAGKQGHTHSGQQDYLSAESGDAPAVQPRRIDGLADDRAGGRSK